MKSAWLESKRGEYPYWAVSPDKSLSPKTTIPHCSAVISEGERTYAFKTKRDRADFMSQFDTAVIVS